MTTSEPDAMEPQPHGGALMRSNQPGRPKNEVRHKLLQRVEQALDRIEKMIDGTEVTDSNVFLKAVEICARYGVGTQDEKVYLDNTLAPQALARALALHENKVLDQDTAFKIARDFSRELGLE